MNPKQESEEYYAQLAEHRSRGDANESNAEGTIFPRGEPIESTGRYSETGQAEDREQVDRENPPPLPRNYCMTAQDRVLDWVVVREGVRSR